MTTPASAAPRASADVVRGFFTAFGSGNVEALVQSFAPSAQITAVHEGAPGEGVFGSYVGQDGARAFVAALGRTFDTKAFSVDEVVGEGNIAYASGHFTHQLKRNGKPYTSAWALRCVVERGAIVRYHFYEDSAAFVAAAN